MESRGFDSSRLLLIMVILCTLCAAGATAYTLYAYIKAARQEASSVENTDRESLQQGIATINATLQALVKLATKLADQAGTTVGNRAAYDALCVEMQTVLKEHSEINSLSASYEPYMFDPTQRLHSVQYARAREGSSLVQTSLETWYDYTIAKWYIAAKTKTPAWIDPLYDASIEKAVTSYIVPFFVRNPETNEKTCAGVFAVDIAVDYLDNLVESFVLHKNSYAMLVTHGGIILAHPSDKYAQHSKTIFDLATEPGYKAFILLGNKIARDTRGELTFTIEDNFYKRCRAIFGSIPKVHWTLVIIGPAALDAIPTTEIRHLLINLVLALMFLCSCISALFCVVWGTTQRALWLATSLCAFFIGLAMCIVWIFCLISVENHASHANIIDSPIALSRFFYLQNKTNALFYKNQVHFIPTGLYLYTVTLDTTSPTMSTNGHIWQKFDLTKDADLVKEVIIFNATEQSFEKVYDVTKDGIQTIGWRFHATIKGNFDYIRYPFDQQNLIFELGNKNYADDVILVPDFAAFTGMRSPHSEIDPSTSTAPWIINSTYSFYELTNFNTDFGIKEYTHQTDFPTLCFNIAVSRDFIYPFMAGMLPIAIIFLVAFSILLIIGLSDKGNSLASLILSLCSGLFFATILSHQTFQRTVESSRLTYFEYFYFLIYAIILIITIDGLLYALDKGGILIDYRQNSIARFIFWPVVFAACLVVTLIFFY